MFDEFLNKNFFKFRSILEDQKTINDKYKTQNKTKNLLLSNFKNNKANPKKENLAKYAPGINSLPKGPVNLPYQLDLKPSISLPNPEAELYCKN